VFLHRSNRDLTRIHGLNERVHASDSANCIRFFYQLIRNSNEFSEFDF
jgi:acetylornithine deacetylase/succinyl-diaminopimelate desuccinylase-like protein